MKPTYEELEQQLAESHRALRAETTAHDHVKMHLEKMAAENVGLKEYLAPVGLAVEGTPATDAFLAEVRAQGVDSAINTVIAMMNHQHPVTSKAIDIMRVHAYQIRKGVQS
ncbi:TPA: hypothetical protein ACPFP5_004310 [Escherichia coli]